MGDQRIDADINVSQVEVAADPDHVTMTFPHAGGGGATYTLRFTLPAARIVINMLDVAIVEARHLAGRA